MKSSEQRALTLNVDNNYSSSGSEHGTKPFCQRPLDTSAQLSSRPECLRNEKTIASYFALRNLLKAYSPFVKAPIIFSRNSCVLYGSENSQSDRGKSGLFMVVRMLLRALTISGRL